MCYKAIYAHHDHVVKWFKRVKTSSWSFKVWKAGSFVEKLLWLVSLLRGAPRHWHRKTPHNFPRARVESHQADEAFLVRISKIRITWSTSRALIYVRIYSLIPWSDDGDCWWLIRNTKKVTAKYTSMWIWNCEILHYHHPPWTSPKSEWCSSWVSSAIAERSAHRLLLFPVVIGATSNLQNGP